jgi:hypothetical protein
MSKIFLKFMIVPRKLLEVGTHRGATWKRSKLRGEGRIGHILGILILTWNQSLLIIEAIENIRGVFQTHAPFLSFSELWPRGFGHSHLKYQVLQLPDIWNNYYVIIQQWNSDIVILYQVWLGRSMLWCIRNSSYVIPLTWNHVKLSCFLSVGDNCGECLTLTL